MSPEQNHCCFLSLYPVIKYQILEPGTKPPSKGTKGSSGWDVFSPKAITIPPRGDVIVGTNLRFDIPFGFDMTVVEKSGVATKKKLDIGACLIDSDYRGAVHVHLFNNSDQEVSFDAGEKIAQLVIRPVWMGKLEEVDAISTETTRGEGAFGSTGVK